MRSSLTRPPSRTHPRSSTLSESPTFTHLYQLSFTHPPSLTRTHSPVHTHPYTLTRTHSPVHTRPYTLAHPPSLTRPHSQTPTRPNSAAPPVHPTVPRLQMGSQLRGPHAAPHLPLCVATHRPRANCWPKTTLHNLARVSAATDPAGLPPPLALHPGSPILARVVCADTLVAGCGATTVTSRWPCGWWPLMTLCVLCALGSWALGWEGAGDVVCMGCGFCLNGLVGKWLPRTWPLGAWPLHTPGFWGWNRGQYMSRALDGVCAANAAWRTFTNIHV